MRAIDRDVVFEKKRELSPERSRDCLEARPEKPVMHDQEIDAGSAAAAANERVEASTAAPILPTLPEFSTCTPLSACGQSGTAELAGSRRCN